MPAKIAIIYYSMYGHVKTLAEEAYKGAVATGATVDMLQFPETLSEEILGKMHAGAKSNEHKVATPNDLKEYDGFMFAFPTRYGRAISQVSAFMDATGQLWATGGLVGKMAATITSTATQQGGQETTHLTTMPFFVHHGIIFVPLGYTVPALQAMDEITGGSPWGASTFAKGDGSRKVSAAELEIAEGHGKYFANVVNQFVAGKTAAALSSAPEPVGRETETEKCLAPPIQSETILARNEPTVTKSQPVAAEPTSAPVQEAPAAGYNVTPAAPAAPKKQFEPEEVGEKKGWKKYICC